MPLKGIYVYLSHISMKDSTLNFATHLKDDKNKNYQLKKY